MAAGDILSVTIGDEGWYADVVFEGMAAGGTYTMGLDAAGAPTTLTPRLAVTSEGYNAAGVLGTIARTVYLTTPLRQAYPSNAQLQESVAGGNLTVRMVLSSFVYDDDKAGGAGTSGTDPTFSAPAGWLVAGGVSSAAKVAGAVTNSSTKDYPPVLGNWTRPDRERLAGNARTYAGIAFGAHPRNSKPVACVTFTATDTASHTASTVVATPVIDMAQLDAVPVVEYVGTVDLTGFTDDTLITGQMQAFPWVGDENSVLDSSTTGDTEMTGIFPPSYDVLDVDASRGYPIIVVDPAGNDAATGTVYASDTSGNRALAAANPVATLYRAIRNLYVYNNASNSRANALGGKIYLRNGTHLIFGGTTSTPNTVVGNVWTWTTVTPFPGDTGVICAPDTAVSANRSQVPTGIKWQGITFQRSTDSDWTRGTASQRCLFVDCSLTDTRTSNTQQFAVGTMLSQFVRCTLSKVWASGSRMRGCSMPVGYSLSVPRAFFGNSYTQAPATPGQAFQSPSSVATDWERACVAFNKFTKLTTPWAPTAFSQGTTVYTRGAAVVQNLVELLDTTSQPAATFSADSTFTSTRDCIIWHNTMQGQRWNLFYNDEGTTRTAHLGHSVALNAFEYYANKGDTFNAPVSGPNGGRTGNWPVDNGVLNFGNKNKRGAFNQRFPGLYSKSGTDAAPIDLGFVNDKSGPTGTGGGDYHPAAGSLLLAVPIAPMLALDLDGSPRLTSDAAGAYAATYAPVGGDSGGGDPGGGGTPPTGTAQSLKTLAKVGGVFRKIARAS